MLSQSSFHWDHAGTKGPQVALNSLALVPLVASVNFAAKDLAIELASTLSHIPIYLLTLFKSST